MVRFGFISLPQPVGATGSADRKTNSSFSQYEECQSEKDANGKNALCKVPPMPMGLSGH
jgi:hypothetical protein